MTVFAASQRLMNAIEACFGKPLSMPKKFRAKKPSRSGREAEVVILVEKPRCTKVALISLGNIAYLSLWERLEPCRSTKIVSAMHFSGGPLYFSARPTIITGPWPCSCSVVLDSSLSIEQ
jgi:hypothetical protein